MARPSTAERLATLHEEALTQFDTIQSAVKEERQLSLEDRRFYSIAGAQWEGKLGEQFENKPRFEVNKVHLSVIRIVNEYRNNRITVDFVPKDGSKDDKTADLCDGLYRADEKDSCADEAYDNAFEEAVGGGIGAWRLRACLEDEEDDENDRQRVRFEPIYDADSSVFFDLDAKRQNKSDARYCFVVSSMSRAAYEDEYDDDPASWPADIKRTEFDWETPDVVYVAEYYRVEMKRETLRVFVDVDGDEVRYTDAELADMVTDLTGVDYDDTKEAAAAAIQYLADTGTVEVRKKTTKRRRVLKYIMSGGRILEDCGYIAGKYIPVIPCYGKRWFIDNIERAMGHVRLAKDPQRLKNMQLSKLGEISALSSVEKPIFAPEQIAGHEAMWAEDNLRDWPYLLANPMMSDDGTTILAAGPTAYTRPPMIPQALAALLQLTEQDMAEILGSQQQGDKMVSNISGKAVEMIQERLDMQSFIYMSNFAKAMEWSGHVWLSMARELYVEQGRKMKTLGPQGETAQAELMRPVIDEDGARVFENDLSRAKFDVAVDVGPSFSSRRAATVRALTGMMTMVQNPEDITILTALSLMNMEGEGLDDVREYYRRKMVMSGVLKPTEEEQAQMDEAAQNAQPSPQDQYLEAEAEKSRAAAVKAQADTGLAVAKTEETRAKTAETLAGIDLDQQRAAIDAARALTETLTPAN